MRVHRRSLLTVAAICVGLISAVLPQAPAGARPVSWGTVLVRGIEWAGPAAALGDLNVYSNGTGSQDRSAPYGLAYECVELAQRWAAVRFGEQPIWPVAYAYQMWDVAPRLRVPFQQLPNGGAVAPQFGDIIVYWRTAPAVAQAVSWQGWDIARGLVVQRGRAGGYVLDGFGGIHAFGGAPPVTATGYWPGRDIARGIALRPDGVSGYVLDGWGGIH